MTNLTSTPPPPPPPPPPPASLQVPASSNGSPKARTTYVLLGVFLGALGVHNFYAGRTTHGIIQLAIWLVSIPLMFIVVGFLTIWVPVIWSLIEVFVVTTDGDGRAFV